MLSPESTANQDSETLSGIKRESGAIPATLTTINARIIVLVYDKIRPEELDRRELQLTLLACCTILILGAGLALLMYPLVFARSNAADKPHGAERVLRILRLSALLAMYLVDRQVTILRLRRQLAEDRRRAAESRIEASAELLNAIPESGFVQRSPGHGISPCGVLRRRSYPFW